MGAVYPRLRRWQNVPRVKMLLTRKKEGVKVRENQIKSS